MPGQRIIEEDQVKTIFTEIVEAVAYLHE